jgi:hypothetical protein
VTFHGSGVHVERLASHLGVPVEDLIGAVKSGRLAARVTRRGHVFVRIYEVDRLVEARREGKLAEVLRA